jgi:hypothetical protein
MTIFEQAVQDAKNGKTPTPIVNHGNTPIDYFGYQLAVHKFDLNILAVGMKKKGVKLKDLKTYYGLTGRTAKECVPQLKEIIEKYKATL